MSDLHKYKRFKLMIIKKKFKAFKNLVGADTGYLCQYVNEKDHKNYSQKVVSILLIFLLGFFIIGFASSDAQSKSMPDTSKEKSQSKVFAGCVLNAALTYELPSQILLGIYEADGGEVGEAYTQNGLSSFGIMKVPEIYVEDVAKVWGVDEEAAIQGLKEDPCVGTDVSAWKLRGHLNETGSLSAALKKFGKDRGYDGTSFLKIVMSKMQEKGLMEDVRPKPQAKHNVLSTIWYLVINLPHGFTVERRVEGLAMCGLKSQEIHYDMMIEERFFSGDWSCTNVGTGKKVTGKKWLTNKRYQDPFDKGGQEGN